MARSSAPEERSRAGPQNRTRTRRRRRVNAFAAIRAAHAWAGLALCGVLAVIALSGSLLVLKNDYIRLAVPEARQAANLSPAALGRAAEAAEAEWGAERLRALVFASPELGVHRAYLTEGRSAYLSQSGEVIAEWGPNGRLEDWVFDLHHRLLGGTIGLWVAGLSGLAAAVLVAGGLAALWPARRGLRRGLKITAASRPQLLSLHRNLGLLAALPVLFLALSGAALTFPETARALFDRAGGGEPPPRMAVDARAADGADWRALLPAAAQAMPEAVPRMAIWPRADGHPAALRLRMAGEWHPNGRSMAAGDPASGAVLATLDANREGMGRRAFNTLYPLHAAKTGGPLYEAVVFLSGLALFALSLSGAAAFWKRRRRFGKAARA